ncbi:MAG: GNAT family N-acetyltransferase [Opitutaceae bacterium]|nr:GNAT family N-acetyltransferase [Opitutaceae bacterium]
MPTSVTLRAVDSADLPVFFEHQLDPEATRLAAFPSRERDAFMAHWAKILADPACVARTIVHDGRIAGNIGAWTDADTRERLVGYWIGRAQWGRGIATAALSQFCHDERARPLTARVAKHNTPSLRVLQKCGFVLSGEDRFTDREGQSHEEFILTLDSRAGP